VIPAQLFLALRNGKSLVCQPFRQYGELVY
jgi:hypothetical protein